MLSNWAESVVLLPSGSSHVPVNVPPTPVVNGIIVGGGEGGLLSLNGVSKETPHHPRVRRRSNSGGGMDMRNRQIVIRRSVFASR